MRSDAQVVNEIEQQASLQKCLIKTAKQAALDCVIEELERQAKRTLEIAQSAGERANVDGALPICAGQFQRAYEATIRAEVLFTAAADIRRYAASIANR